MLYSRNICFIYILVNCEIYIRFFKENASRLKKREFYSFWDKYVLYFSIEIGIA